MCEVTRLIFALRAAPPYNRNSEASRTSFPQLTTVRQNAALRAGAAVACIEAMRKGRSVAEKIVLPVTLLLRESTGGISCQSL